MSHPSWITDLWHEIWKGPSIFQEISLPDHHHSSETNIFFFSSLCLDAVLIRSFSARVLPSLPYQSPIRRVRPLNLQAQPSLRHHDLSTFAQHQDTLGGSGHRDTLGDPSHLGTWAPIVNLGTLWPGYLLLTLAFLISHLIGATWRYPLQSRMKEYPMKRILKW